MAATLLLVLLNAVILTWFFFFFRRRIARSLESGEILRRVRSEIDGMIVDINESAERNIALVEERIARVSGLLADADHRIAVLAKEAERSRAKEAVYNQLRPRSTVPENPAEDTAAPKSPREEVLFLHDQGMESRQIASKLNKTLGEVQLIISLGGQRR